MTRKTLSILPPDERGEAPALQKKGRGWKIGESRLDTLHETARELRRNPTPAQEALAAALVAQELGKYRLRRQVVIGSAIVDFACQPLGVAVEIDEAGADPALEQRRDASLAEVGVKVLRFAAEAVLADAEGTASQIVAALKERWQEQQSRRRTAPRRPREDRPQTGRAPSQGYRK